MYLCQARPTCAEADRQVYGLYTCLYTLAGLPLPPAASFATESGIVCK